MVQEFKKRNWDVIEMSCPDDELLCLGLMYGYARSKMRQDSIPTFCTDKTDWILGGMFTLIPAIHTHVHKFKSDIVKEVLEFFNSKDIEEIMRLDIELLEKLINEKLPPLPIEIIDEVLRLIIDYELSDAEISHRLSIDIDIIHKMKMLIFESSRFRSLDLNGITYQYEI